MTRLAKTITEAPLFRGFIIVVILWAGVLAGLETSAALMASHGALFRAIDSVVLAIFVAEIGLKLAAHGRRWTDYFRDGWNAFDCAVVALCFIPGSGSFGVVLRLARVLRLLRLVTMLPKLQLLVGALLKSLSSMGYVTLLMALLFYIYAVAGVHLFGESDEDFGSLTAALFSLFRVVTLDNWSDIFNRAAAHAPMIKVSVYFVTFIVFGTMIILNLFIGIILNSMSETHAEIEQGPGAVAGPGSSLDSELQALEQQVKQLQESVQRLRQQSGLVKGGA